MTDNGPYAIRGWSSVEGLVQQVLRHGNVVSSRYGECLEILGGRLQIPSSALVTRQKINYSLGWMEMFQLLGGLYNVDQIKRVAPNADHSLFTFKMAYGPRVMPQLPILIDALLRDPGTRQAVLFVGHPEDGPTSELPCTVTIQFLQREGILHAIVHMRSWDLCRGLPYDLMMFSGLLEMMGRFLMVETGNVTVLSGSTHIYLDQAELVPRMSGKVWQFTEDVPDNYPEAIEWFRRQIPFIERGQTPHGIEFVEQI